MSKQIDPVRVYLKSWKGFSFSKESVVYHTRKEKYFQDACLTNCASVDKCLTLAGDVRIFSFINSAVSTELGRTRPPPPLSEQATFVWNCFGLLTETGAHSKGDQPRVFHGGWAAPGIQLHFVSVRLENWTGVVWLVYLLAQRIHFAYLDTWCLHARHFQLNPAFSCKSRTVECCVSETNSNSFSKKHTVQTFWN